MAISYVTNAITDTGNTDYTEQADAAAFADKLGGADTGDGSDLAATGDNDGAAPAETAQDRTLLADNQKSPSGPKTAPQSSPPAAQQSTADDEAQVDKLERDLRTKLRNDPAASAALKSLLADQSFDNMGDQTKMAILSQVANYPDARSIAKLQRLPHRADFIRFSLPDKQRMAKVVAFAAQYWKADSKGPGNKILANTYDTLLASGGPHVAWDSRGKYDGPKNPDGSVAVEFGSAREDDDYGNVITFNRDLVPDGNGPVTDKLAIHLAVSTPAHEISHYVNGTRGGYFDEARAWYVAFEAEFGRAPTNAEMLGRSKVLITAYKNIKKVYDANGPERKAIDADMKRFAQGDPKQPAPPPQPISRDDPNILDNKLPEPKR